MNVPAFFSIPNIAPSKKGTARSVTHHETFRWQALHHRIGQVIAARQDAHYAFDLFAAGRFWCEDVFAAMNRLDTAQQEFLRAVAPCLCEPQATAERRAAVTKAITWLDLRFRKRSRDCAIRAWMVVYDKLPEQASRDEEALMRGCCFRQIAAVHAATAGE